MSRRFVYLVWHTLDGSDDAAKVIGVYSTEQLAAARIERARALPGLAAYPNDFRVTPEPLDHNELVTSAAD